MFTVIAFSKWHLPSPNVCGNALETGFYRRRRCSECVGALLVLCAYVGAYKRISRAGTKKYFFLHCNEMHSLLFVSVLRWITQKDERKRGGIIERKISYISL